MKNVVLFLKIGDSKHPVFTSDITVDKDGVTWTGRTVKFSRDLEGPCLEIDDYMHDLTAPLHVRYGEDPAKKRNAILKALEFLFLAENCPEDVSVVDWMKDGFRCRRIGKALAKYGNRGNKVVVHYLHKGGIEEIGGTSDVGGNYWTWMVPFEEMKRIIELGQSFDLYLKESRLRAVKRESEILKS